MANKYIYKKKKDTEKKQKEKKGPKKDSKISLKKKTKKKHSFVVKVTKIFLRNKSKS